MKENDYIEVDSSIVLPDFMQSIPVVFECKKPTNEELIEKFGKETADAYLGMLANCKLTKLSEADFYNLSHIFSNLIKHDSFMWKEAFVDVLKEHDDYFSDNVKDYAEILLLLEQGRNIKLSADIPHKGLQTIELNKEHLIFRLREIIDDYLLKKLEREHNVKNDIHKYDFFHEEDLKEIIQIEEKKEIQRIDSIGRNTYSARLGEYILGEVHMNESLFSKLSKGDPYRLLGGFLVYCGHVPSYTWEDWEVLDNRHKKNVVEGWTKAYVKHINKFYDSKVEASEKE